MEDLKLLIDINIENMRKIPEAELTDELIYYALSKSEKALLYIPENKITKDMCEFAFNNFKLSFKYIPLKYKSYDMCLSAVIYKAKFIKQVPLEILTQDFLADIRLYGGYISAVDLNYVEMCLNAHNSLQSDDLSFQPDESLEQFDEKQLLGQEVAAMQLTEFTSLFSAALLKRLQTLNINTVGDLLINVNNPTFMVHFMDKKIYYREVEAAVRLLRCKFLGEDPLIDENDDLSIESIFVKLGIDSRIGANLDSNYSSNQFWALIRKKDFGFLKMRGVGDNTIYDIFTKAQIIIEYHDGHPKNISMASSNENIEVDTPSSDDDINDLMAEYSRLLVERQRLDDQINQLLVVIQNKQIAQSKGNEING
ncbi:MAG: hypothetical protein IJO63_05580 [Bacilli bacterium]|nr:hypothetical protein [Bacilli bacterium]